MAKHNMTFKLVGFVGAVLVALVLVAVAWYKLQSRPVSDNKDQQVFVIKKGESITSMGVRLSQDRLIRSSVAFRILVKKNSLETKIQAGSFRLSQAMSLPEVAKTLTVGRQDIWVTILEGLRREEIAQALEKAFAEAGSTFDQIKFLTATIDKEGYLFPDTYLFPMDASEENVASILETTFKSKVDSKMLADLGNSGRSLDQVVTMASLIEREARDEDSRSIVAGILWKRLDNDWGLEVDATLQYASGYDAIMKSWWVPPMASDKSIDSPYNTYRYAGLPPGPIAAPSLSSIQAAIYPEMSDYWFYLTDNSGVMHYGRTLEEHNENIDNYLR